MWWKKSPEIFEKTFFNSNLGFKETEWTIESLYKIQ